MNDRDKSGSRLIEEMHLLKRRIADLEMREAQSRWLARALAQSEEKFRILTEQSVAGVYLVQDHVFRYVNPRMAQIFGYPVDELVDKKGPRDLVLPQDRPLMEETLMKRISGETDAAPVRFRGVGKRGDILHLEVYGSRTEYKGRPAIIGTLLDITEKVQSKKDLEGELNKFQALYDLAVAMTAEQSVDENLSLVVEKSRLLLSADKAFIALRDETSGELYMHTLSGIVTEEFKNLRIPFGKGLGGRVAQTGRWRIVEDYLAEIEPIFHETVRKEGLVSGIAVPVKIGATNVGVLYVFDAVRRDFTKSDLDTLSLLGNLAAVEITGRRFQERLGVSQESYRILYEESRRREDLYLSLLNSSADAIVIYDMEGRTQHINPSFTGIFGWTLEELEGKRIPFMPDAERESSMAIVEGLVRDGTPCSGFETRRTTKDGRLIDVSISASRCRDHEGKPAGLLVILRDISERKQVEEALRKGEESFRILYAEAENARRVYRTLLDASPEPIVVYDVVGRPTYCNPAFTKVFGWTFEEVKGRRIDFVPEENRPETDEMIRTVLSGRDFSGIETRRTTKDGRIIDVSVSGAIFPDTEGNPTGSVVHLRDITARKVAEAKLAGELKKFQALYELALAMIAERSLDENLSLVVDKSRELLHADMAYIALREEGSADLCMHTTSGTISEEFKSLRIPFGKGLGGKVAETGQWYIVEDYLQEIEPIFHDIVLAEGMVSGIAVPVKIRDTNVGVLYVFNRSRTDFSQADLDALSLLGNLAAVEVTRKRSEERLRDSQESYRTLYEESKRREELYLSLLNSSVDAIVVYDMEGIPQYVNPSFTQIFGWTLPEIEGRPIPFMPETERESSMKVIHGLIRDGTPCSGFETRRYTKDRRIIDISISASRCHDHEGNPVGLLVVLRDISGRKMSEKAIKESEERFRTLAEVAPLGLVILGADERTEYVNPKFTDILGYRLEDLPDADAWFGKAYPSERTRRKAAEIWRAETADIKVQYGIGTEAKPRVFTVRCKNGESKILSFHAVLLADGRIIATFLDVTSETRAQQEILRAKNEWERTFHGVSDLIMVLDDRHRIARINRAMADRLGIDPDELIGAACDEPAPGGKKVSAFCPDIRLPIEVREYSAEVYDEGLGGAFDLRISPLRGEGGRLLGSVHVARDITAFKSMERARRLAVHHLSHELKTPLAIIKGSVKDLERDDVPAPAKASKVERIRRSLERLSDIQHIVQEIVEPRTYSPRPFEVLKELHRILGEIRQASGHRAVEVIPRGEEIRTDIIDPEVFEDVVRTLVKNAIENTPDEGEVEVSLSRAPAGVLLQVKDRGVGVPASDKDFLFEAFHHTQETERYATKNPFDFDAGGKGLELMRLKILSEAGGFRISFQSRRCSYLQADLDRCPGKISACTHPASREDCRESGGTTFSVLFPG